ncbi:MerR family transcriptional regulator [Streptomyces avicenniae]|uniref:MerR family transcriptional regulator n=1 Tax=Streptomyces avicenniae TaxID=500153 RepID=UPI00069A0BBD|nr:MerR family transcriptional regulator [Streptomyces avicenniae]
MNELIVPEVPVEVPDGGLSIGDAATACGLSIDTLRYYEREGLTLSPAQRNAAGQRRYGADDLRWLAGLVMLRGTGMRIGDIRRYTELARRPGTEAERLAILERHREHVLARMAQTGAHLAAVERKIAAYRAVGSPTGKENS